MKAFPPRLPKDACGSVGELGDPQVKVVLFRPGSMGVLGLTTLASMLQPVHFATERSCAVVRASFFRGVSSRFCQLQDLAG